MGDPDQNLGGAEIAFEAFGVCMAVGASEPELLEQVRRVLPPGWSPCPAADVERRFFLTPEETGTFTLAQDGDAGGGRGLDLDLALEMLDSELRLYLGRKSRETIFIHAGTVSHHGVAMVIPSASFGGKTTLVAALVRAGAVYYSDEFAVIGGNGLVQPYPKPLSVRGEGFAQTDHPVETFGGVAGDEPLPLGLIVITSYRPGADWKPRRVSPGAGAMALLENAVPAKERSEEVMHAVSRAAQGAAVIESDRGEADEIAPLLLAELERHAG